MTTADDLVERIPRPHQLLLVAALGETDAACDAWSRWRRAVVFDDVDGSSTRLLPILARRPDVVGPDDPLHGRIRGLYRKAWVQNEQLLTAADTACRALVDAHIPLLHVEARTLATAFGEHATRPLYDVDMCIPRRSMRAALGQLSRLGWVDGSRNIRARWQRRPHHLVRGDARLRLIDARPWPGADASAWATSIPGSPTGTRRLGLHDALIHASLRSVQPWQPPGGYWVADVVRLAAALGHRRTIDALDDALLLERAAAHGKFDTVRHAIVAADRIVDATDRLSPTTGAASPSVRQSNTPTPGPHRSGSENLPGMPG